jgi:hypothetical protein
LISALHNGKTNAISTNHIYEPPALPSVSLHSIPVTQRFVPGHARTTASNHKVTSLVNHVYMPPTLPGVSMHSTPVGERSMPVQAHTSIPHDTNILPPLPNTSVHCQPIMSNPMVSHIPISSLQTNFVPLPRTTLNQIRPIGGPYQGAATADPSQRVTRPAVEPRRAESNLAPTERETFSQVAPVPNSFPGPQAACSQAPPTSHGVPPSWDTSNMWQQGAWYQEPSHSNENQGPQGTSYQMPPHSNENQGTQGTLY